MMQVSAHSCRSERLSPARTVLGLLLPGLVLLALGACGSVPESRRTTAPGTIQVSLHPVSWAALPGWKDAEPELPWRAFLASCGAQKVDSNLAAACEEARSETSASRAFFERWFVPHRIEGAAGSGGGLLTGYYEPLLRGSRAPTARASYPVYGVPDDLLQIDLGALYPELAQYRLRGRVEGRKVVPYHDRAAIDNAPSPLAGRELLWVEDPIALFFLHIQGSGKVILPDGSRVRLGYADQNGHPYKAIGKVLVDRGELRREEVSLQSIRAWLQRHPDQAAGIMAQNGSYVFFNERPDGSEGPLGAQGVALVAGHSIAVDPRAIALGSPVYIDSTWPDGAALRRLTIAQDTGGAIRGAVRADLFLGEGEQAEAQAGRMRQPLRAWVLVPRTAQR